MLVDAKKTNSENGLAVMLKPSDPQYMDTGINLVAEVAEKLANADGHQCGGLQFQHMGTTRSKAISVEKVKAIHKRHKASQ